MSQRFDPHQSALASLSDYAAAIDETLASLQRSELVNRIWRKEHTVWSTDPTEIADRLGWLTIVAQMRDEVPSLAAFADSVREQGFQHVLLLGMGGSSLGPEVLRQTFGRSSGYPELIVLDSTIPAWISAVDEIIDPARTLFVVSSKSGTTIEVVSFYRHFRSLVERAIGSENAGDNFVAITDAGTPLERLAAEQGFRRTFLNPGDIGGRYSVLSYFGLVPAALAGIDIALLLERADRMQDACGYTIPTLVNPGAWLGVAMGRLALEGRDKLTLVASPSISSLGLWIEQLIAESTGKDGRGIVPVTGEPLLTPDCYGDDRQFVYLRVDGDDNASIDAAVERLKSSGQPLIQLDLHDLYDLGSEFFRWQFATAVAGALLGIHPFDQPNVQQAKDLTASVLSEYTASGRLPQADNAGSLAALLNQARPGDYLAITAYLHETLEIDRSLADLRRRVMERHRIATTLGYGPRYLHSTGQLHKGGANRGLFLQLTADHPHDIPIPGEPYTFAVLADAQAIGDLRALRALGRRVAKVHLGSDNVTGIRRLVSEIA
jgi:glucose-6-phosphate isomerase/transaldolase/glucose-6-phosphate isomerase